MDRSTKTFINLPILYPYRFMGVNKVPLARRCFLSKEEFEHLYWEEGLSTIRIAQKIGVSDRTIRHWMEKLSVKRRTKKEAMRNAAKKGFLSKHPNLELSPTLSYVLGVLKGDGYVYNYEGRRDHVIGLIVTKQKFAESFKRALEEIGLYTYAYSLKPQTPKRSKRYCVAACSKVFFGWYKSLMRENIEKMLDDYDNAIAYIRGFYESEGSSDGKRYLRFYNKSWDNIHILKKALEEIGFKYSIRTDSRSLIILRVLGGFSEVKRFLETVKPAIKIGGE